MRKLAKVLALFFASVVCFCCFCGCEKTGPIPDGKYDYIGAVIDKTDIYGDKISKYIYTEGKLKTDNYWEIKGDEAWGYCSNSLTYKGKIVERDGKIYVEGYKWLSVPDLLLGKWMMIGSTVVYLIEYNAEEKILTEELYKKGD
ncbi:MAG: hypothetical protein IJX87_06160 [Clostridia bacterium]|nr:hypothetical protein [Clostridia bacterium]